ncbi:MAG: long-chain fatty acid--CoA ligase [Rhizobiaceae bacterium]|nr:long-chain fatty acid--CoA ligase [Rhizobiaceae bacterium]MCV0407884.1 long-chain fatty acid--CoA ligase [Rhizobiaceae bacterium]
MTGTAGLEARPWTRAYPPGLSPAAPIAAFPVPTILDRSAKRWGDKTAFEFRGHAITYRDLKAASEKAARAFAGLGVKPGDRVALLLPNTPYHPFAFFGALAAGAVVVHLSPLDAPPVLKHKIADSGARIVVTTDAGGLVDRVLGLAEEPLVDRVIVGEDARWAGGYATPLVQEVTGRDAVLSWTDFLGTAVDALPTHEYALDDLALLQYTGGTTGMPKAAMLTHRNLSSAVSAYDLWFEGYELSRPGEERVLLYLPLFHIYGLTAVMLRCLNSGHTVLLRERFDPNTALDEIEAGATALPGVPTMWIAICATEGFEKRNLSSLKLSASGGAPMPVEVAKRFADKTGLELRGGWGMSETSPAGTNMPPNRPDKPGTIGIPLPGVDLRIVSVANPTVELKPGETGELAVRGPNVTRSYHNRPDENRASFVDGWFLTGDIGHMDQDGFFFIVDRKKDMIISGGFNVYPQMIEQAIYEHPDVEEVLVIGVADAYRGEAAKAFVKLRAGAPELSLDQLRAFLKGRVGPHEMPAELEIRPALPRTPVGKLSKLELKQEERAKAVRLASKGDAA